MKKIKVYLQYPWKFPDSPYYKYLLQEHPKEIEYLNVEKQKGVITNKAKFLFSNKMKKIIRDLVKIFYPSMINAHLSPKGDYDLIHCAHCLSKNKDKPWVCDLEFSTQVWVSLKKPKNIIGVKRILLQDNCKKIITWTEKMKKELVETFPEIKNKVDVVFPIIPKLNVKRIKHKEINLFFVARYFYLKGGLHALELMDRLTKKYSNVNGIIVSEVPKEIRERYSKNERIKIYNLMSQKELFERVYSTGDIFVYPGYSDSFGFAIPEVMSLGIPVVSADVSTRKEIITNEMNGFIIPTKLDQRSLIKVSKLLNNVESKKIIRDMEKKCEKLIKDKKLREEFGKKAKEEIVSGKFSAKNIKERMNKIYEEALK